MKKDFSRIICTITICIFIIMVPLKELFFDDHVSLWIQEPWFFAVCSLTIYIFGSYAIKKFIELRDKFFHFEKPIEKAKEHDNEKPN